MTAPSLDQRIEELLKRLEPLLPPATYQRLDAIPGINRRMIENIIAEIGVDMGIFPDASNRCVTSPRSSPKT